MRADGPARELPDRAAAMLHVERFRAETRASLDRWRAVRDTVGIHAGDLAEMCTEIERELDRDLTAMRPRPLLEYTLGLPARYQRLCELDAPPIILDHQAKELRASPHWLHHTYPTDRWRDHPDAAFAMRYFDPEPTTIATFEGFTLRHAQHGEDDTADAVPESIALTAPFLAHLAREPRLWAQHRAILAQRPPFDELDEDDDAHALLARLADHPTGCYETAFVLGRLAHLVGTPPDLPALGFELHVVAPDGAACRVTGFDREGHMPTIQAADLTAGATVARWLCASAELADVAVVKDDLALGVRHACLFFETVPRQVLVPTWLKDLT